MLKPLTQSRSPASPIFHYAPASQSLPASPLSRTNSRSKAQVNVRSPVQAPAQTTPPPPRRVRYVDAGTQWESPIMNSKKETVDENSIPAGPKSELGPDHISSPDTEFLMRVPEKPSLRTRRRTPSPTGALTSCKSPIRSSIISPSPKRARPVRANVKVLPIQYEFCDVTDIVILIANMISELIQTNDGLPLRTGVLTRFHSRTPPGISVLDYLQRLAKHATLTPPLLLSMVYYMDRLCSLYPAFTVTTLTIHRFLITAATVAAKGLSDSFWNNSTYARVGGIKLAELGLLELEFLYRVDWKIVPNPEVLVDYYRGLVERSEAYELKEVSLPAISSDELDEDSSDAESNKVTDAEVKSEEGTDAQWKAWMTENSSRTAGDAERVVKEQPKEPQ